MNPPRNQSRAMAVPDTSRARSHETKVPGECGRAAVTDSPFTCANYHYAQWHRPSQELRCYFTGWKARELCASFEREPGTS